MGFVPLELDGYCCGDLYQVAKYYWSESFGGCMFQLRHI